MKSSFYCFQYGKPLVYNMKPMYFIPVLVFLLLGCSSSGDFPDRTKNPGKYPYRVYILNEDWHTGIVLKVSDVSEDDMPEINQFQDKKYIDIGWGDEVYYRIPGYDLRLAARALFSPTSSALKIRTLNIPAEMYYKTFRFCVSFNLTREEFKRLCKYISDTYRKDSKGKSILLENRENIIYFYGANYDYHLFNTCNTWVAGALASTGFPIQTGMIVSASNLFDEIKDYGEVLIDYD